jgi:ribosomal protein L37AE/L43A
VLTLSQCEYKTKNRNAMRVHMRTKHVIYYCMKCRAQFGKGAIQVYKAHEKTCGANFN